MEETTTTGSISIFNNNNNPIGGNNFTVAYQFDYRQPLLLIYLIYTLPSIYIYSKCRQQMIKSSVTSHHFNMIFNNDFYINVALFLVDFLFTRIPISGLFVNYPAYLPSNYILTIIYFLSYYLIYANFFSITLICFNRMTSVVFPYSSNTFWYHYINYCIALVYILPLIPTWQLLSYEVYFISLRANTSGYQMVYRLGVIPQFVRNSTALVAFSFALSIICVIANLITITRYKKAVQLMMSATQNAFHRRKTRRTEVAMVAIAIVVCVSLVLQCILQTLIMLFVNTKLIRETAQDMRAFCLDLSICCPPWILYYTTISKYATNGGSMASVENRTSPIKSQY